MSWISEILRSFAKPLRWWVVVAAWEQAVLVRLGKRTHHLMPGIHLRIPFIDRVYRICIRERVIQCDNRTTATADGKSVTIGLCVSYAIEDASRMLQSVARPEETLRALAQARASEIASLTPSTELSPAFLESELARRLDFERWGLRDVRVYVVGFAYTKTIRLLQAHDNGYSTQVDSALDDKPATVD